MNMKKLKFLAVAFLGAALFTSCEKEIEVPLSFDIDGEKAYVTIPATTDSTFNACESYRINLDSIAEANDINKDWLNSIKLTSLTFRMIDTMPNPYTMSVVNKFSGKITTNNSVVFQDQEVDQNGVESITVNTEKIDVKSLVESGSNFELCFDGQLNEPLSHSVVIEVTPKYTADATIKKKK